MGTFKNPDVWKQNLAYQIGDFVLYDGTVYMAIKPVPAGTNMSSDYWIAFEEGAIVPTGVISITENGEVDIAQYATANVNVEGGGDGGGDIDIYDAYQSMILASYLEPSVGDTLPTEACTYEVSIKVGNIIKDICRFPTTLSLPVFSISGGCVVTVQPNPEHPNFRDINSCDVYIVTVDTNYEITTVEKSDIEPVRDGIGSYSWTFTVPNTNYINDEYVVVYFYDDSVA